MTNDADAEEDPALAYSYGPRPAAPPVALRLAPPTLTVDSGRRVDHVRLSAVEQIRLTYAPRSFGQNAYRTKLTLSDGKTVGFASVSWKSMVEAERQDEAYRAFLGALVEAVAKANPKVRLLAGQPMPVWVATVLAAVAIFGAIGHLIARAIGAGSLGTALFGVVVGLVGLVQIGPMLRLNKPGAFDPRHPPARLMP